MKDLTSQLANPTSEIVRFAREYFREVDPMELERIVDEHWVYGTIDSVYKDGEIIAVVRWNISADGRVCDVLDLLICEGENGFRVMKHLIARNWHRFPTVRHIRFDRPEKYPGRSHRMYPIRKILQLGRREKRYGQR